MHVVLHRLVSGRAGDQKTTLKIINPSATVLTLNVTLGLVKKVLTNLCLAFGSINDTGNIDFIYQGLWPRTQGLPNSDFGMTLFWIKKHQKVPCVWKQ